MASATWRVVATALALAACSGSGTGSSPGPELSSPPSTTTGTTPAAPPRVDLIDDAVAALETRLGAAQQYFEINATSQLVNLFVALNDGKLVQPWVYLDGELSSTDPREATGFTFASSALDFDPATVLSGVQAEVPEASLDVFFVEGGKGGAVQYSVAVTSRQGGQLVVVVGPDGKVQSVTPS